MLGQRQNSGTMTNGGGGENLGFHIPEIEIIADILSYLPPIPLLRFKSACKAWQSLISDPQFINLQSNRAFSNPKILFSTCSHIRLLDFETPSLDRNSLYSPLNFPAERFDPGPLKIVGSIAGLVCLTAADCCQNFRIWNPITGEIRKIPDFRFQVRDYLHGLGYDSVSNDFRLVIWVYRSASIFSLNSNSWKVIQCPLELSVTMKSDLQWTKPATTLATVSNGFLHWLVTPNCNVRGIVAFDLAKERFQKLQMPTFGSRSGSVVSLFEHRGCLCLSFSDFGSNDREIWMMKEYGEPKSWVCLFSVSQSLQVSSFWRLPVVCVNMRDEAVLHTDKAFIRSLKDEDKFGEICVNPRVVDGVALYVDTFVSPYDFKMKEQRG